MADIYACICGISVVADDTRVMGSTTYIRLFVTDLMAVEHYGYATSRILFTYSQFQRKFHLECPNLDCAPKGWRCETMYAHKGVYI